MLQLEYHHFNGFIGKVLEMLQYVQILTFFPLDQSQTHASSTRSLPQILVLTSEMDFSRDYGPLDSSVSFLLGQLYR